MEDSENLSVEVISEADEDIPAKRGPGRPKGVPNQPKTRAEQIQDRAMKFAKKGKPITLTPNEFTQLMEDKERGNSKITTFIMAIKAIGDTADLNDVESLRTCMYQYLELASKMNMRITNMGLYTACGISRKTVGAWISQARKKDRPEFREFAEELRQIAATAREQYGVEGSLNPVTTIWMQKIYDGYREDEAVIDEKLDALGDAQNPDDLRAKWSGIIVEDVEAEEVDEDYPIDE